MKRRSSQRIQDRRGLEALHRLAVELPEVLTLTGVTDMLAEHLVLAIGRTDECTISTWDADQDEVTILSVCERDSGIVESYRGQRYPLSDWPLSRTLLTAGAGHAEYRRDDPDWNQHARALLDEWGWQTWIALPLVIGSRPVGLIEVVDYRHSEPWSPDDVAFCQTIAGQAAMAVRSAQLNDLLVRRRNDPVTGLLGAQSLRERLEQLLAAFDPGAAGPAVIMLRLRGVTASTEDEPTLRLVADALRACCREEDVGGRTGPDELALVLPRADPDTARAVAERVSSTVADRAGVQPTVGVALAQAADRDARALLDRARSSLPSAGGADGSDRCMSA